LRLLLDEERAVTASRVRLVSDNGDTTARGMAIDLGKGTAQLLSDVETRYEN
jgi:lipopolysaccharide export system protein LptC